MSWRPRAPNVGTRLGRYGLEYRYRCPKCHHTNLWWVPSRSGGKCWTCAENLDLQKMQSLFRDFSATDEIAELLEEINAVIATPRREKRVEYQSVPDGEQLPWQVRYYLERGRPVPTALDDFLRAGCWYDERDHRVHFPLSPILGGGGGGDSPVYSMSRTPDAGVKDWLFLPRDGGKESVWFNPVGVDSGQVILVEGPFDVLAPGLLGKAIGLCGLSWTEDMQYWLHQFRQHQSSPRLFVWLDPDEAGREASTSLVVQLRRVVDVTEIQAEKESGDCTPEEALEILKEAGYDPTPEKV